jgi:predicted nuclease of restriction endonuclease-like (RecB) superfamily
LIIKKQEEFGWGKSVILLLSRDLPQLIGEGVSWSPRNLQFMKQLVAEYSNVNHAGSQLENTNVKQLASHLEKANVKQPVSHLEYVKKLVLNTPWRHNILILQKVKEPKARVFYLEQTIKNKYSSSVLLHQIKANAYEHYTTKPSQHNFAKALPEHFQEQARESIKSVYSLDFLDINKPVTERDLENTMVENVKRLMLELGYGFCFIGNQYRLSLGDKDYFIDLLFYHRILKCLVAVELKVVEFEPEFVGKLDFYLQLMDEQLKQSDDQPSIGILLVPEKNHLEVEYTLRNANNPIGVAEYILSKQLPKELIGKLPTAEEFQRVLISETKPKKK